MNQVIRETAATAQYGWLVGLATVLFMALFLGIGVWLLTRQARAGLEEAAQLPLLEEEE